MAPKCATRNDQNGLIKSLFLFRHVTCKLGFQAIEIESKVSQFPTSQIPQHNYFIYYINLSLFSCLKSSSA